MIRGLAFVGACVMASAAGVGEEPVWLDLPLGEWHQPGAAIPRAPEGEPTAALRNRCPRLMRPPSLPEERMIGRAGWKVFGRVERMGDARVISGFTQGDGMCRPSGQQAFVFVGGRFAGTLWPEPTHPRTDGAPVEVELVSPETLWVRFARYTAEDALCCPSSFQVVTYRIRTDPKGPVVVPLEVQDPSTAD